MPARTPLSDADLDAALAGLPGWSRTGDALAWEHAFADVPSAAAFIVRVLFAAEAADHHPEITTVYTRVALSLSTHDAGNRVTETDLALARTISGFMA
ncbi:MAG TPA: 4a-hydroxytetrahydrobiopterin dehydratase [Rubricoccaceae bacterium]|jgi:4a-hydroxytetrahydrobiopterin dehydratase